jgi:hypothetical protein
LLPYFGLGEGGFQLRDGGGCFAGACWFALRRRLLGFFFLASGFFLSFED